MEGFRQLIKGWLGKFLLGVVVFVFVIYGAESLMVIASRPKPVAEINGDEITRESLDQRIEQYRRAQIAQLGDGAKDADLSAETLAPKTLEVMVDRILLTQRTDALSMAASEMAAKKWITSMPEFQEQDGKFSEEIFKVTLARAGYSPQQLINEVRSDHKLRQLQRGIVDSYFMTDLEVQKLMALQDQSRDINYAVIPPDLFLDQVVIEPSDLEEHYKAYQADFEVEDQAKFEYLLISSSQFSEGLQATEEELQEAYQARVAVILDGEERRASHILITPDSPQEPSAEPAEKPEETEKDLALEKIESLKKQIAEGADFAELAKEHSMDPGSKNQGGDLGFTTKGVMVDAFDKVLFSLKEGEVSEIVKTDFGYHIIKLHEIKIAEKPLFDEIKASLEEDVIERKAQEVFAEKLDEINQLAYESGDLSPIVETYQLESKETDWVFRSGGEGLFSDANILKAAFSNEVLKDGFNSDAISLGDGRAVVLRLSEYKDTYVKPLQEVRDEIEEVVKLEKAQKLAVKKGREIIASLRAGKPVDEVTKEHGLNWREEKAAKRFSMVTPRSIVQKAFTMPHPQASSEDEKSNPFDGAELDQGFAVIELRAVNDSEEPLSEDETKNMRQFLTQQLGQLEVDKYLKHHKTASDIEINL